MRLGNWQLNGIVTVQSGTPFTVFESKGRFAAGQRAGDFRFLK